MPRYCVKMKRSRYDKVPEEWLQKEAALQMVQTLSQFVKIEGPFITPSKVTPRPPWTLHDIEEAYRYGWTLYNVNQVPHVRDHCRVCGREFVLSAETSWPTCCGGDICLNT